MARHHHQQLKLLTVASTLPRVGGWLLYSICSTEPEETDGVRSKFLERNPWYVPGGFQIDLPPGYVPTKGVLRILPGDGECDGVYASLFIRTGEAGR
jgi:16S rRNA (cytosine967-C5)-methyltransferase